ncbi:MAG: dihydroorotase [Proteobacteria bacterium]|nr:dihydroorotase [Pseudomonadota bacterium]MBU1738939.1 dihydroorotase [Pseudomonadota bacterium]
MLLQNGRVIDPSSGLDGQADILVVGGRVKAVGTVKERDLPPGCKTYDLGGLWVTPGLIDMHVHLREPGEEYKETIASGTMAAAAGGFTAVACMPNTSPINDSQGVTSLILARAVGASARVYPVGSISKGAKGEELAEFGEMKTAGVVALSDDGVPVVNSQLFKRALEYSGNYDLLLISHSEEIFLSRGGAMNDGSVSTRLGLRGIPSAAESIAVYRDIALAEYTGRPVHIAHVSTGEAVDLIRRAKSKGCRVTAETAPHYFTLTDQDVGNYNTNAKMNPPLRSEKDRLEMIRGLQDGTIDAIATDHAPHSRLEKDKEFDQAANGIIGLETSLPLSLELVRVGIIDPVRLIELMSVNPARILGVEGGTLKEGCIADITVIDPEKKFVFAAEGIRSKSRNSPFIDRELTGKAVMTILGGRITHSELA